MISMLNVVFNHFTKNVKVKTYAKNRLEIRISNIANTEIQGVSLKQNLIQTSNFLLFLVKYKIISYAIK